MICGHIHWASDRRIGDIRYLNCGDWVDSCSAVVEHHDGRIEVLQWGVQGAHALAALPAPPAPERPSLPPRSAPVPAGAERIYLMPDI